MNCKSVFYSFLVVAWLCSCQSSRKAAAITGDKELYTVTVYVKNQERLFATDPFFIHLGQPYYVDEVVDERIGPVSKIKYERVSLPEYEALCRRLKNHPEILAIQKEP